MQSLLFDLSKYVLAFLMAFYCLASYVGYSTKEKKRGGIYFWQYCIMFLIHFLCYWMLFIAYDDYKYFYLYFIEVIYFIVVIGVYSLLYPKASKLLINNMCLLMMVGFIMIARLDYDKCLKQLTIAAISTVITFIIPALFKKVKTFRNFAWAYCFIGITLLIVLLLGNTVFGANLTISIGQFSIQPAEFVKISFVLFVASAFNQSTEFKNVVYVSIAAAVHVLLLVCATDLGAALILFIVYMTMLYIATKKGGYLACGFLSFGVASYLAYNLFGHVKQRVLIWLDPWSRIDGTGYQITQSLFAIGMGSWFGYGLTKGAPERIPVAIKDFMFSAISEEFGIIFSLALVLVCLNNLILMMSIASKCNTLFYRLVAVGLGCTYGFQVFLTVGGAAKLIPMTGVTLPFVSYGGSSILSSLVMFALINAMYNMRHDERELANGKEKNK